MITHMDVYVRLADLERSRQTEALLRQIRADLPAVFGWRARLMAALSGAGASRNVAADAGLEWRERARPPRLELRADSVSMN